MLKTQQPALICALILLLFVCERRERERVMDEGAALLILVSQYILHGEVTLTAVYEALSY